MNSTQCEFISRVYLAVRSWGDVPLLPPSGRNRAKFKRIGEYVARLAELSGRHVLRKDWATNDSGYTGDLESSFQEVLASLGETLVVTDDVGSSSLPTSFRAPKSRICRQSLTKLDKVNFPGSEDDGLACSSSCVGCERCSGRSSDKMRSLDLTRPPKAEPHVDRRTLKVVGSLSKSFEEQKYLPFVADRIKKNERPPGFDPHPRLHPG